uniref:Major facilitator superfamily (MFS) profile domain-containing protein n=1 Tax=Bionectria ochroleuca TaxID=29856 RepID=A0A8H7NPM6_BIOOC
MALPVALSTQHHDVDDAKMANEEVDQQLAVKENVPASLVDDMTPDEALLSSRINRRMDIAMLPMLSLLYLFNGLDKGNIGNAETQGFTRDIGAAPSDLNLSVSLFFITFVLFQPPSAALGRIVGPKHWIPFMTFAWGAVTIGQAFIKGRGALITVRLVIGVFEAGFYPTCVSYLSFFYTRFDLAIRIAIFYGQYAIAGAFAGAISFGIFHLKSGSLRNWQYLFIIEGVLTCAVAIMAWFMLPSGPGSAWFRTAEERKFATERMQRDTALYIRHEYGEDGLEQDRLTRRDIVEALKDWKLWFVLVFNICASVPTQAFSVFMPLVVQGLGYSSIEANLMTIPPYVCGAVGLFLFAWSSDKRMERGFHIIAGIGIGVVGLIIAATVNANEPGKRTLILGINGFGNLAGVIGSQVYDAKYGPSYRVSFFITLGIAIVSLLGYISYRFTLAAVNRRKRRILSQMTPEEIASERIYSTRYADRKRTFIYGL